MGEDKHYIAVDLGADSGRVMLSKVSQGKLTLAEAHRFSNGAVEVDGTLRWDFEMLMREIKNGIGVAAKEAGGEVAGIGVDSWGVDFGLLDERGTLIEPPYHYRDARTNDVMKKAFELMPKRDVYENTGLQFMQFNSVYQLLAMRLANEPGLAKAKTLVFIGDLVSYMLCGRAYAEYTLASTSQFMDMRTGEWSKPIFEKLSLPMDILPEIVAPGTLVGKLTAEVAKETGCEQIPVIAVASHDTGSAIVAVPAQESSKWAYLSCGTWSLMGVEAPHAIINDKTFAFPFTNEGGVEGTIRLLKNIIGLWLLQESKRHWEKEGEELSYGEMTEMAKKAKPFAGHLDTDYGPFLAPGDMPIKINQYLKETGQAPLEDKGQMIRVILESLALRYRQVLEKLEEVTGDNIDCLHMVGGGIQNELLCQFAADAIGRRVVAGPVEGTAIGNVLMQAKATGQVKDLWQARKLVRDSFEMKEYQPKDVDAWQRQYEKFMK